MFIIHFLTLCLYISPNRSSLSDGSNNKTANNRIRITLSARAGSHEKPIQKVVTSHVYPVPSSFPHTPSTETHTESLPSTTSTLTTTSTNTNYPIRQFSSKIKADPISDHYYSSDHDDPLDYYDNVDEISIPRSSPLKLLNNSKAHSSSSIQSSSSSLSQSTAPFYVPAQSNRLQFRLPDFSSESRYDQSTLKSFFMMSSPSTTVGYASLVMTMTTTEKPPTTTSTTTVPSTTSARDLEAQRQKILAFIVSENQPSTFKAAPRPTNHEANSAFVHKQESTTSSHPNTTSTNAPRFKQSPTKTTVLLSHEQSNKPIRLTLSASLDSGRSSATQTHRKPIQGSVEQNPLIKPETRHSLHLKPIEATTYSPPKPFRTSTEPIVLIDDAPLEPETFASHSRRRPYVNDFLTNANNIPTRFPPRSTSTTSETPLEVSELTTQATTSTTAFRSVIQSFTSRGLVFKESLNRTFDPHSKPIVSPFISLETQRLTNAIRTTTPRPTVESTSPTSKLLTTTTLPPYRSYFLITAPVKDKSAIPTTFLFPETSTTRSSSLLTTLEPETIRPSPFSLPTEASLTEINRGRYRPFVTLTPPNAIVDEEPTTYAPRLRFNTRTQTMVDSGSSSLPPTEQLSSARRKVIRLKSGLQPPGKPLELATTASTPLRPVSEKFVASPSRETSDFRPLPTKVDEIVSKLSHSSDSPPPSRGSFNQLSKDEQTLRITPVIDIIDKPFYYIRFKNASGIHFEPLETSTKKFRATVEMPEMNVPTERELKAYVDNDVVYDEEENAPDSLLGNIEYREHEVGYAYDVVGTSTVAPTTFDKISFNTTYSTVIATSTQSPTNSTLTSTSLRTTENEPTTTANPKSLIPPRASRVNSAIKTSIVAGLPRRNSANSASIKCNEISANAKCNEIPSRYY